MNEKYLIINAGSSSLKFSLYLMPEKEEIVNGNIERIGEEGSFLTLKYNGKKEEKQASIKDHTEAIRFMLNELLANNFIESIDEIKGIGHRVLHGGEKYKESALINDEVIKDIKDLTKLGPLHHPGEIKGIESMIQELPEIPQVAVFDTAFHQTMPMENFMYATPFSWYEQNGVRKYGFHGTSHKYITEKMQQYFHKDNINLIICHIGSGASISCIKNGLSYDTSMGLTPLDGLIMGTRSGSIDPSIIEYISKEENLSIKEITHMLNKESGLLGICGKNDNRDVEQLYFANDKKGILAMNMLKNSIVKYIAQYYMELEGNIDALIFTAGIGENGILLRKLVVEAIEKATNVKLDNSKNDNIARFKEHKEGKISTDDSSFEILVIPTNEESMILQDTYNCIENRKKTILKRTLKNNI